MSNKYEPVGYVAGVACDPVAPGGYTPIVHFYEPGKPGQVVWVGAVDTSLTEAMFAAEVHLHSLATPGPDDVLAALCSVLDEIKSAGNLMAITHGNAVTAARTLVAQLRRSP
jgi:hypothetical protein